MELIISSLSKSSAGSLAVLNFKLFGSKRKSITLIGRNNLRQISTIPVCSLCINIRPILANLIAYKLIESASAPVKEDIIAFAVVDFELVVCPFSVPRSCYDVQVVVYAVLYVFYFKSAKSAVIGNGGVVLADFFFCQGITS